MTSSYGNCDAVLVLEDGTCFVGRAFGATTKTAAYGELVFNTAMTGYQETLTDPSYHKQIVIQTTPHIGNTGMNNADKESDKIWVAGYVVRELSQIASNWRSEVTLSETLQKDDILGIEGLDTRHLTRHLRDKGVMKSGIFSTKSTDQHISEQVFEAVDGAAIGDKIEAPSALKNLVLSDPSMDGAHLAPDVTTKTAQTLKHQDVNGEFGFEDFFKKGGDTNHTPGEPLRVVCIDLGIKKMTPKLLVARGEVVSQFYKDKPGSFNGVEVINVPLTTTFEELKALNPDGVFYSNGPGDPGSATTEVELLRQVLEAGYPFFGICMGNQMLGRALGFGTYKLKFGHRGVNQPVKDLSTGAVAITAHNHGFAIDVPVGEQDEYGNTTNPPIVESPYGKSDGPSKFGRVKVSHIDLNDNVVEGIECLDIPAFSVQYHPEAAAGPHDAVYLFDKFINLICYTKEKRAGVLPGVFEHQSNQGGQ
jgi:carbamoyl-phosphate synthase small subunit